MFPSRLPRTAAISACDSPAKNSKDDHVALLRRELGERRADREVVGSSFEDGARLVGIDLTSGLVAKRLGSAPGAGEVDHGVSSDAKQPGPEREASLLVAWERLDHLDEDLLQEILAVGRLWDTHDDEAVDPIGVEVVQGTERIRIASLGTADERVDIHVIDH